MESLQQFLDFAPEVLVKLIVAVFCGGAVGMERERHGKPAGLRTNILICVGSTLYTIMSIHIMDGHFSQAMPSGDMRGDVSRIASQIVVGIGFLGAGTILRERGSVVGLTSAAMVWTMGAIGIFIGVGYIYLAIGISIFCVITLVLLGKWELRALGKCQYESVKMLFRDDNETRRDVVDILSDHDVPISDYTLTRDSDRLTLDLRYCTVHPSHNRHIPAMQQLNGFVTKVM